MLDVVIEVFRGIAACWVFLFHMDRPPAGGRLLLALADSGNLGVPMFFVISGYCIGASAALSARRGEPASAFLRRRLWRIYPPFWASIVILVALPFLLAALSAMQSGHFVEPEPGWFAYSPADWVGLATLSRVFFSHGQGPAAAFETFNVVYWTLAIEVQFYIVMYLALLLGAWAGRFLLAVTVAGGALALMPAAYKTGIFLPFWPLFAAGLALNRFTRAGMVPAALLGPRHAPLALAGATALLLAFVLLLMTGAFSFPGSNYLRLLATIFGFGLGFAALLWFAIDLEPSLARLLASGPRLARMPVRLLLAIGAASYSIYLLHGELYALPAMLVRLVLSEGSLANLAATMALTIAFACLFSIVIERRFVRRRSRAASIAPQLSVAQTAAGS